MATFAIQNLSFTYPREERRALSDIDLTVEYGEFVVLCGPTGCGKSTLLRNLKTVLTPHGTIQGDILFYGKKLADVSPREQAGRIGYVLQDPDNQIVTDKVWHELAFGLENLGYDTGTIRLRTAEMASFFGIEEWFHKKVNQLSGGQKQLLNLAAVMAMQPDVLILDEPTSQLDPIAAIDFLESLRRINREIGTTILLSEHRLEEALPMADRVVVLDAGKKIVDASPGQVGRYLSATNHSMLSAMPTPMQVYERLGIRNGKEDGLLSVRAGRTWLTALFRDRDLVIDHRERTPRDVSGEAATIQMKDVWFRYDRREKNVMRGLSFDVFPSCITCMVGGNGSGKTTILSLIAGLRKPYRGTVRVLEPSVAILPQDPRTLFLEKTVALDLSLGNPTEASIEEMADLVGIYHLLQRHPYDLSGGEQQLAALARILLSDPQILLLDEPTKGIDSQGKDHLGHILQKLARRGKTILIVSHDIEFCGKFADHCAMVFDGTVVSTGPPDYFFPGNSFYTTAANRMSRHIFRHVVTPEDVVVLCRENLLEEERGK